MTVARVRVRPTDSATVLQSLDKLDKKTVQEVRDELSSKGFATTEIDYIFTKLQAVTIDSDLQQVMDIAGKLGVTNLKFDPTLVRGLDYYTGTIFETIVTEPKIGSITGGGRYDKLIKSLGGPDLPAVGTTLGLDRICDVVEELNLWPDVAANTKVLVTIFSKDLAGNSLEVAKKLRDEKINVELYPDPEVKLEKQLKYASTKSIPYVIILGPEEIENKTLKLKNMQTGEQTSSSIMEVSKLLGQDTVLP
jgi:histidyl-tRNA synthetase